MKTPLMIVLKVRKGKYKVTGIYIHFPFCKRKCPYCDFYSVEEDRGLIGAYVCALKRNFSRYKKQAVICDTIYFGGGTPSLLEPFEVGEIISALKKNFVVIDNAEITLEANPSSLDFEKLVAYRNFGVNRISIGVQSANNSELSALGRLHDFDTAAECVLNAKKAGFDNISCDLMIGTPRQNISDLLSSARKIIELPVNHISAYMLKIEEGTMFDCDWVRANVADDEEVCDMYEKLVMLLESNGFMQYEISNFAKDGFHSRHNLKYWTGEPYLGFGPAAHSYFERKRFFVLSDVYEFISNDIQEELIEDDAPDKAAEYLMLSLRLKEGMSFLRYTELGGDAQKVYEKAEIFEDAGYLVRSEERISLTTKGFLVSNGIISELSP